MVACMDVMDPAQWLLLMAMVVSAFLLAGMVIAVCTRRGRGPL